VLKARFRRAGAALLALALAGGAAAQTPPVRIVALGASNTEGFGVSTWEAYPVRLQALLKARGIDAEVINAGLSGDTTAGMLARLDASLLDGTHLLILQPGGNDARHGRGAETAGNITKIKSRLDERGILLIIIDNAVLEWARCCEGRRTGAARSRATSPLGTPHPGQERLPALTPQAKRPIRTNHDRRPPRHGRQARCRCR
jgi:acyl-CoA thioesterase-1